MDRDELERVIDVGDDDAPIDDEDDNDEQEGGAAEVADASTVDQSAVTFDGHTDEVFCIAACSARALVCSGGMDDRAFVWNAHTGDVV